MRILQKQQGFILYITLIMLIIFAVIGLGLYQQNTSVTRSVQYVSFKQETEDLAMRALNQIEETQISVDNAWKECTTETGVLCDAISENALNKAVTEMREGKAPSKIADGGEWKNLKMKGEFSGNGQVYYVIQNLGLNPQEKRYRMYRTTIIAQVLDTFSVISSVMAAPAQPAKKP
ncbi:hypothetical protein [Wohlfahrtiimonas sp. G9077]|uniref:hypothetical protein n=1 Tax=Wohlfahrtiimonas sp. G9077 TaxID=1980118 RepID=UPI000B99CEBB|nr:hypothetical protein [Wohlfahrtiimonas sp. G9077]OYQ74483.1 hypothetical protein B9T20_04245 [Wohlfahrtiimonas sp. G9077]